MYNAQVNGTLVFKCIISCIWLMYTRVMYGWLSCVAALDVRYPSRRRISDAARPIFSPLNAKFCELNPDNALPYGIWLGSLWEAKSTGPVYLSLTNALGGFSAFRCAVYCTSTQWALVCMYVYFGRLVALRIGYIHARTRFTIIFLNTSTYTQRYSVCEWVSER